MAETRAAVSNLACVEGDHDFEYLGVRYADGAYPLPGSGARRRYYADTYFCKRCLEKRGEPMRGLDECTYQSIRFGALPGSDDLVGVPRHDRPYGGR